MSDENRRAFAVPLAEGEYDDIDLSGLDRDDEDDRRLLIQAEHPEFREALAPGQREVHVGGVTINPVLHIAMHEIVAAQLLADDPPELWETAERLLAAGYGRHEVLHMLASVVSGEVFDALRNQTPPEIEPVRAALAALPESWEHQRAAIPEGRHLNRTERRAAARKRRHRARWAMQCSATAATPPSTTTTIVGWRPRLDQAVGSESVPWSENTASESPGGSAVTPCTPGVLDTEQIAGSSSSASVGRAIDRGRRCRYCSGQAFGRPASIGTYRAGFNAAMRANPNAARRH